MIIEVVGLEALASALERVSETIGDVRRLAPEIFKLLEQDIDQRFRSAPGVRTTGRVHGGVTWPSLSEAYLNQNRRRRGGKQLRDTGALAASFQIGGVGNVAQANQTSLQFGSNLSKTAAVNQTRPLVVVHDSLVEALAGLVTAEIERQI